MKFTTNYNLNLYELDDNANLTDGYNNSMEKLDTLIYQLMSMLTSANNSVTTLQTEVESLKSRVSTIEGQL